MSSWSKRRKISYAVVILVLVIGVVGLTSFRYFYKPATCFDGLQNGGEFGIDCGGACQKLCASAFFPPSVAWTRFEQVAPGLYNLSAYIINPNTDARASHVPYHMVMYDGSGVPIIDTKGTMTIPPHRNTLAFLGALNVNQSLPVKASFEFLAAPEWKKQSDILASLVIADKNYNEDEVGSSLQVSLSNTGVRPLDNIAVYVVLYDKDKNAIGFSKTIVDEIPAQGTAVAPFTWPVNRHGAVISQEVLPVAE